MTNKKIKEGEAVPLSRMPHVVTVRNGRSEYQSRFGFIAEWNRYAGEVLIDGERIGDSFMGKVGGSEVEARRQAAYMLGIASARELFQ